MNEVGFYFVTPDAPCAQPERGRRHLQESAAREDVYGYNNLGLFHLRGLGGLAVDEAAAAAWFERGDAWAGANAAWLIANRGAGGLGPADAAMRAAKAAVLRDAEAAAAAEQVLAGLPAEALDRAAQAMLAALGEPVAVDGRFGPQSRAALARRAGDDADATPRERALAAARAHWRANPFRPDMF